jgi:16S rRNA G966 N2-methylase RsmD
VSSGCIDEEAIYILEKNSTNNIQLAKRFELLDSRKQGITEIIFFKKL